MNYNTKLRCTYNYYDEKFKDVNPIKIEEEIDMTDFPEDISTNLYRSEFLEAFNLQEYKDDVIDQQFYILYKFFKDDERLKPLYKKLASKIMSEDEEIGFVFLFSYDYFFLMHLCICDFLEMGEIQNDNEHIEKLMELIMN